MEKPADFSLEPATDRPTVRLSGDWTANHIGEAGRGLAATLDGLSNVTIDLAKVRRLDTAGAYAVVRAAGGQFDLEKVKARPETSRLLALVAEAVTREPVVRNEPKGFHDLTIRIGKGVVDLGHEFLDTMGFLGHLLVVVGRACVHLFTAPQRIRWPAIVTLMERAGLDAIPIVAITSFFIGAVVGLLGANMLRQFGAEVFAVELIGIAVLREFNIIITAVLLAGRSASSFAAELGSMKMNQEVDAMRVLGVDPFEALVLPRFVAMLVTIPLLTFVATLAGLSGGLAVTWSVLDLGPAFFLQRIVDNVGITHFWIALSKAPVMAAVIAGIGCRQGLEVGGDVESLGRRVTAAVVHAIFAIIMIDAAFALLYMELDL
ncbi:ABC transporter permease [Phenylobacterium sp. J367]|uniref:ABC transporter permease n=1 Tax=Phenylobacterium sp. J367 TaxID=2898435 RepID=UPI00215102C9|nr:ABC transporter permease [Phenylobacterium sp. J367]MCR5879796.1 ABC transporter permease [Phenylobacterium sp. J367]